MFFIQGKLETMISFSKFIGLLCCCFLGLISAFILQLLLDAILIPDPCAYHGEETTKIFDLFYKITSDAGYHPLPTSFNYILTIAIGLRLGYVFYNFFFIKTGNNS
jgi:hypothetical protein